MATRRRRAAAPPPPRKGLQLAVFLVLLFMMLGIVLPVIGLGVAGVAR